MLVVQHNCNGSYHWTMVALETGIRIKAQLVLLQEPTTKWGIRHPGYRLLWPQEGGNKPRTMVAIRVDGNIKVEYRSGLGKNAMANMMVLDITIDTGKKIRVVNLYDQLEKGRTSSLRTARQVRWQDIMTEKTIVCGDFNSHSRRWDINCKGERDPKYWKDWQEEYMMQLGNNGQPTRNGSNRTQSVIDLTWSSPLESPLAQWRTGTESEETGSDHRLVIWEAKHNPGHNPVPSGEQIRWDISRITDGEKDKAELLWLQMEEHRPILNDMNFCEKIESEAAWIQDTLTNILNQKARRIRICAKRTKVGHTKG
jgi:hypothetical protein